MLGWVRSLYQLLEVALTGKEHLKGARASVAQPLQTDRQDGNEVWITRLQSVRIAVSTDLDQGQSCRRPCVHEKHKIPVAANK